VYGLEVRGSCVFAPVPKQKWEGWAEGPGISYARVRGVID
jgi:hypothetical protein